MHFVYISHNIARYDTAKTTLLALSGIAISNWFNFSSWYCGNSYKNMATVYADISESKLILCVL